MAVANLSKRQANDLSYTVCDITDIEMRPDGLCDITYCYAPGGYNIIEGVDPAHFGGVQGFDRVIMNENEEYVPVSIRKRRICGIAIEPSMSGRLSIHLDDGGRPFGGVFDTGPNRAALGIIGWDLIEDVAMTDEEQRPEDAVVGIFSCEDFSDIGVFHAVFESGMIVASFAEHDVLMSSRYRIGFDFLTPKDGLRRVFMYSDRVVAMPPEFARMLLIPDGNGGFEALSVLRGLLTVLQEA